MKAVAQRFTDEEVRRAKFLCETPLTQDRLVPGIPAGAELLRLENIYQLSKSTPKIRCAACGRALHHKGFTGLLSTTDRILLGSKCGSDSFGSWELARRDLEELRDRQYYLRRIDALRVDAANITLEFKAWRSAARTYDANLARFNAVFPDLYSALRTAARNGGWLTHEERMQRRVITQTGVKATTVVETITDGPLPAPSALQNPAVLLIVDEAEAAITELLIEERDAEAVTTSTELAGVKRVADRALEALEAAHAALAALPALYTPAALQLIAQWARRAKVTGEYVAMGSSLQTPEGADVISLPPDYRAPTRDLLERLAVKKRPTEDIAA